MPSDFNFTPMVKQSKKVSEVEVDNLIMKSKRRISDDCLMYNKLCSKVKKGNIYIVSVSESIGNTLFSGA